MINPEINRICTAAFIFSEIYVYHAIKATCLCRHSFTTLDVINTGLWLSGAVYSQILFLISSTSIDIMIK